MPPKVQLTMATGFKSESQPVKRDLQLLDRAKPTFLLPLKTQSVKELFFRLMTLKCPARVQIDRRFRSKNGLSSFMVHQQKFIRL